MKCTENVAVGLPFHAVYFHGQMFSAADIPDVIEAVAVLPGCPDLFVQATSNSMLKMTGERREEFMDRIFKNAVCGF